MVRKLIYARNKIFQNLKTLSEVFDNSNYPWTKGDHLMVMENFQGFFKNGIDRFELWKIDKKLKDKEYGSDVELSE